MCDEQTNREAEEFLRSRSLTRRDFSKGGIVATLAMMLPPPASAVEVIEQEVIVKTPDGSMDGFFVHPAEGKHAAVIVWPDIVGIRPAFRAMGTRLAKSGYSVFVVNPYYRTHVGQIVPDGKTFRDPGIREMLMPHARSLSPETCVSDGKALVSWLDSQPFVDTNRKIGTTGYCMTGSYTIRIGAGGSFHGGGLATDGENSPHLLVPQMKASFLIAIAENDDERRPEEKHRLRQAFDGAGVSAEIEVYNGALHGWCPPDSAVYNEEQAERAWGRLLELFDRELA